MSPFPFPDCAQLATESDVEQKLILPLLKEVLGFNTEEIKTKEYLVPTDIDKGAGKKLGYYPDYLIYLGGIPVLVVEAKAPSISIDVGYREARLYAVEINKRFGEGINPVNRVLSTNGVKLVFSAWDSEKDRAEFAIDDLLEGSRHLDTLRVQCSRSVLIKHATAVKAQIFPPHHYKPLTMSGGPSRQNVTLAPNTFAADLAPLLRRFFDPDETKSSLEVIERAYCSSDEITKYNSTLEALLKDRIPQSAEFSEIKTTKKSARTVDDAIQNAISLQTDVPDPFILLVGSVGAGKSMFVERYISYLADSEIKNRTHWSVIDFNTAPDKLDNIEQWVCGQFVEGFAKRSKDAEFFSFENLKRYFAPEIAKRAQGPYKLLKGNDESEYIRRLTDDITRWSETPDILASGIIRYYAKDRHEPVVVVFDNVDKRDRDQQLRIFQSVQWFRSRNKCFTLLSLRDETYDAYRNQPPLDAFLKPFAFRITAPRFTNVVRKRLELVIAYLSSRADKTLTYTLSNGMEVVYPSTKLGQYLLSIYLSIFNPTRQIRLILEALAGRNIRRALEMFVDILTSGYLREDLVFSITEGRARNIPEWLVIRVLMRTNYLFFADSHGYVQNIFAIPENSITANNFLVPEILDFLAKNRKKKTNFNIEGYYYVKDVIEEMSAYGYLKEDVLWAMELLLQRELILADHQRTKGIQEEDYIKISASGFYHARFLSTRSEYLSNVSVDTYYSVEEIARRIVQIVSDKRNHRIERLQLLRDYLIEERRRVSSLIPRFLDNEDVSGSQISRVEKAILVAQGIDVVTPQDTQEELLT